MIVLLIVLTIISYVKYKRSLMATLAEWYLFATEKNYTDEKLNLLLEQKKTEDLNRCILPKRIAKQSIVCEQDFCGMQVFNFNAQINSEVVVVYLHGGAYFRPPRRWHWKFIYNLSQKAKVPIVAPVYPKAPRNTCDEVYQLLTRFYAEVKSRYKKIILAGDSSGGGLALGLAEYLEKQAVDLPNGLILLSPWVDVSLSNPDIAKYEKLDPIVFVRNVKILGKTWAGELSIRDYRVSPLFGQMPKVDRVDIFCGTREVLYPENIALYEKLSQNERNVTFHCGRGLNHVYPIFPIPEALNAQKEMVVIIKEIAGA